MRDSFIFDIGCHIGEDSDFYLKKGFTVVAVEANPVLCRGLNRRFSQQITDGRFILIEKAIAEEVGEVEFFMNLKESIWGTIRKDLAERNAATGAQSERIFVPSIQFASLISQFGIPYYLKIDIEGADLLCLQGLLQFNDRPRYISMESEQGSLLELRAELSLLSRLGYRKFQIVDQRTVPQQIPPNPAREGIYSDYRFQLGASGLFGKELQGVWSSDRGAKKQYLTIFLKNKIIGFSKKLPVISNYISEDSGSWYDIHGTL